VLSSSLPRLWRQICPTSQKFDVFVRTFENHWIRTGGYIGFSIVMWISLKVSFTMLLAPAITLLIAGVCYGSYLALGGLRIPFVDHVSRTTQASPRLFTRSTSQVRSRAAPASRVEWFNTFIYVHTLCITYHHCHPLSYSTIIVLLYMLALVCWNAAHVDRNSKAFSPQIKSQNSLASRGRCV
jgi:hypothetical protein